MSIDFLLKNGMIIDGADMSCVTQNADIAIEDDRIKAIGDLSNISADRVVNIRGLCVSPGFIDVHSHSEFYLLADGRAESKICQGISTEVNGNCGISASPLYGAALEQRAKDLDELCIKERWNSFPEYFSLLKSRGIALNFMSLVGHGNLRASVAGYTDRPLSESDRRKMYELLEIAIQSGAKGLSTGLIYPPGIYSDTSELVELTRGTKKHGGIYTTHMRSEGDGILESVDEVISIAEKSNIHAHISHLKTSGEQNWTKLEKVFEKIELAGEKGIMITCDRYPYTASSTDLDAVLPAWAFEGGRKKELKRLKKARKRLSRDILASIPDESFWGQVIISSVNLVGNKWMEGKSVSEISRTLGKNLMDSLFDILIEEELQVGAIFFLMNEENLKSIMKHPLTVIGTDSSARSFDGVTARGMPHPRGFGSFPRILGKYVREQKILTLGEAIYKMTGLPAKIFRINHRGIIKEGYFADLVVFDPEKVNDCAEYSNPFKRPQGIHHVFVNGKPVLLDGELTYDLPGIVLK